MGYVAAATIFLDALNVFRFFLGNLLQEQQLSEVITVRATPARRRGPRRLARVLGLDGNPCTGPATRPKSGSGSAWSAIGPQWTGRGAMTSADKAR
jgi:hypothetical protein